LFSATAGQCVSVSEWISLPPSRRQSHRNGDPDMTHPTHVFEDQGGWSANCDACDWTTFVSHADRWVPRRVWPAALTPAADPSVTVVSFACAEAEVAAAAHAIEIDGEP
jgi:hypothetical protein